MLNFPKHTATFFLSDGFQRSYGVMAIAFEIPLFFGPPCISISVYPVDLRHGHVPPRQVPGLRLPAAQLLPGYIYNIYIDNIYTLTTYIHLSTRTTTWPGTPWTKCSPRWPSVSSTDTDQEAASRLVSTYI